MLREITRRFWITADYVGRVEPGRLEAEVSMIELLSVRGSQRTPKAQTPRQGPGYKRSVNMGWDWGSNWKDTDATLE